MKQGDRVKMSEECKRMLRGKCIEGHQGPWDEGDCWGCSTAHVEEFGDCEGLVEGLMDFGTQQGPEWNVRWQPSNLRYGYHPDHLVVIG